MFVTGTKIRNETGIFLFLLAAGFPPYQVTTPFMVSYTLYGNPPLQHEYIVQEAALWFFVAIGKVHTNARPFKCRVQWIGDISEWNGFTVSKFVMDSR